MLRIFLFAYVFMGGLVSGAWGASIPIANGDFETRPVANYPGGASGGPGFGFFTVNQLDDWQRNFFSGANYGAFAPDLSLFQPEGKAHFSSTNQQVAYLAGDATIYQKVGHLAANTDYTLSYDIGNRFGQNGNGSVGLYVSNPAGGNFFNTPTGPISITQYLSTAFATTQGLFSSLTFTVTASQIDQDLVGNDLYIGMLGRTGNESFLIDNLALTAVSPVPLPAAAPLFGSALLGLGLIQRLRRRRT